MTSYHPATMRGFFLGYNENMKKITVSGYATATDVGHESPKLSTMELEGPQEMDASDGYHTFDELYDHRITLFITLCRRQAKAKPSGWWSQVWRSKRHSDGELCFGTGTQYVLGIGKASECQITYHIPVERWNETDFAETLEKAPEWDGHTSDDVLERLKRL